MYQSEFLIMVIQSSRILILWNIGLWKSLGQNSQASGLKESGAKELDAADAKADQIHWKSTESKKKSWHSLSGPWLLLGMYSDRRRIQIRAGLALSTVSPCICLQLPGEVLLFMPDPCRCCRWNHKGMSAFVRSCLPKKLGTNCSCFCMYSFIPLHVVWVTPSLNRFWFARHRDPFMQM